MIYEVINPSDRVVCEANSLAVAAFSVLSLSTKMGVVNVEDSTDKFFEFFSAVSAFEAKWGDPNKFLKENAADISACLLSFFYGDEKALARHRRTIELIDDPQKRETYRKEHEDSARTSMNRIVQSAWSMGKALAEREAAVA